MTLKKERLKEINEKRNEAIAKLEFEYSASEKTGLLCSAIGPKWVVFKGLNSKEEVMHILSIYKPSSKANAFLKFAGKPPIETESPFLLCIGNFKHVKDDRFLTASFKYKTDEGLDIWIDLDKKLIDFHKEMRPVNSLSTSKYPEEYAFFKYGGKSPFKVQYYSGGSITYHGKRNEFLNMFK